MNFELILLFELILMTRSNKQEKGKAREKKTTNITRSASVSASALAKANCELAWQILPRLGKHDDDMIQGVFKTMLRRCSAMLIGSHNKNDNNEGEECDNSIKTAVSSSVGTTCSNWEKERKSEKAADFRLMRKYVNMAWGDS